MKTLPAIPQPIAHNHQPEQQTIIVQMEDFAQVTVQRAAEQLDYSEKTIRRLIQRGEIRTVCRGRMLRIPVSEIRAWQERNGLGR